MLAICTQSLNITRPRSQAVSQVVQSDVPEPICEPQLVAQLLGYNVDKLVDMVSVEITV